jgi:microcystin-dependent protein
MANQKITDLRSLNLDTVSNEDLIPIVDVSENTSPTGELKKISVNQFTLALSNRVGAGIDDKISLYTSNNFIPIAQKGVAEGVAPLNTLNKIDDIYINFPAGAVSSIFGRGGVVTANVNDYSGSYLLKTGDTILGPLNVPITPTQPSQSVSKQYLDVISSSINNRITSVSSSLSTRVDNVTFSVISAIYPIGSLYSSTISTNPSVTLGVGTWVTFGAGKVQVGFNAAETEFNTAEATGGEKVHTLLSTEMPSHFHPTPTFTGTTNAVVDHMHTVPGQLINGDAPLTAGAAGAGGGNLSVNQQYTGPAGAHSHTVTVNASNTLPTGGSLAHNNLQPYIVVYMWKRTA